MTWVSVLLFLKFLRHRTLEEKIGAKSKMEIAIFSNFFKPYKYPKTHRVAWGHFEDPKNNAPAGNFADPLGK